VFYVLSKTLDLLLTPLAWAAILVALGLVKPRLARAGPALGIAVLCFFSLDPVSNALLRIVEGQVPRDADDGVTYDAAVLLGGVVDHRATASAALPSYNDNVERLLVTFDLLRTGRARHAILTGGKAFADDPVIEARTLADQLIAWGIAPERLLVEDRARNTRENAIFTERLAREKGLRSLVVVTSAFHMSRSLAAFRALKLDVHALPVDYRSYTAGPTSLLPNAHALAESTHTLRELFGQLVYRVVGYGG
jgi:uncharacterized SAM-binding protein YcdF (DUF218 family)